MRSSGKLAAARRFIWSFAGQVGKATRPDVIRSLRRIEPHFLFATDEQAGKGLSANEYADILRESVFAPCPMGNVHLESFRVYEALESGAIPIVERRLTLDYFRSLLGPHPMPTVGSWNEARRLITRLIARPERMNELQSDCAGWWRNYKRRLSDDIGGFLNGLAGSDSTVDRAMYREAADSRLWRIWELLRHHNGSATARRVGLHSRRLLKGQRFCNEFGRVAGAV